MMRYLFPPAGLCVDHPGLFQNGAIRLPIGGGKLQKVGLSAKTFIFKTLLSLKAAWTGDWITKESVTGEQRDATSGHEGAHIDRGPEILTQIEELSTRH